ncbi:MAG: hypothetical protein H6730_11340 [Deltaproteobacteria bacterium]|nr:hypothetical protein [Deltaproteobacteria bacterium]
MDRLTRGARSAPVLAGLLGMELVLGGCAGVPRRGASFATLPGGEVVAAPVIDEAAERSLLEAHGGHGVLVELLAGQPGAPTRVLVHGINDAPQGMQPMVDEGRREGHRVLAFAYDDQFGRLGDAADDLARALRAQWARQPGLRIHLEAHSMGARVAVVALGRLHADGGLGGPVDLDLLAPPLAGVAGAEGARRAPGFLRDAIAGITPGLDMAPSSEFQAELAGVGRLPGVHARVFVGARDDIVDANAPAFRRIVEGLGAELFQADAGHAEVPARWVADRAAFVRVP